MTSTLAGQQRASTSAYDCAAVRAAVFASTKCQSSDYLAAELVRGNAASLRARIGVALIKLGAPGLTRAIAAKTSPGVDVFLFTRQAVADDLIRDALASNPDTQTVILGAGLDTSGLRIGRERRAENHGPPAFFEVDLPAMQREKRRLVTTLVRARPELRDDVAYVPCSFGEHELGAALGGAGFDARRPTIWIWSGVIHYLPEAAVRATVRELKELSASASKLFFDFILLEAYERPDDYGFAETKARIHSYGELMSFGFHEGTEHVRAWLEEQGLTFVRSYTRRDMVSLYEERTGERGRSSGIAWSNLCVTSF